MRHPGARRSGPVTRSDTHTTVRIRVIPGSARKRNEFGRFGRQAPGRDAFRWARCDKGGGKPGPGPTVAAGITRRAQRLGRQRKALGRGRSRTRWVEGYIEQSSPMPRIVNSPPRKKMRILAGRAGSVDSQRVTTSEIRPEVNPGRDRPRNSGAGTVGRSGCRGRDRALPGPAAPSHRIP